MTSKAAAGFPISPGSVSMPGPEIWSADSGLNPVKKQRRKDFRPQVPGDLIQMDTVSAFACGIKRYLFTAIDVSTGFAFARAYASNSSASGSDF